MIGSDVLPATAGARVAGVIGWPVTHSRSPRLHGYWLRHYRIDGAYVPLPVAPPALEAALRGLVALGFAGANVTVPHKEAAVRFMDELSPLARRLGAVNTITIRDGRLHGDNTDGFGFIENLRHGAGGWRPDAGAAVVIGAGGAARAVIAALSDAGVAEIVVVNRTASRAERLAADLGLPLAVCHWDERAATLDAAALLVNTTTQGMDGHPPLDLDLARLPPAAIVTDLVYAPLETPLLAAARRRGNPVVDGLGMLLHQGRPGFRSWFGIDPAVTADLRAFVQA